LRFVFDTNVLISALLLPDSKPRQAFDLALQKGKGLLSFGVLAELYDVLGRKHLHRYIDEDDIQTFVAVLTRETEWVDVTEKLMVCRDPKDNKFLELAVAGGASYIVSGDSDLLALHPFRGIQIVPPHLFLRTESG
jgi:putative PIN family toxin of toxin-antitoxin system